MARIRMIKPEFFDDPAVADVTPLARLFFVGLWTQADREGRLADDMRRLKARLFPFDAVDAEALAVELHGQDMIRRYVGSDSKNYIWIRNFVKHQRPHPKEPASVIPPCENGDGKRNGTPFLNAAKPSESGVLILDSGTRNLDKEPPYPPKGGRLTRDERDRAKHVRTKVRGRCTHNPPCVNFDACVTKIGFEARA